jgi:hypothetical protein
MHRSILFRTIRWTVVIVYASTFFAFLNPPVFAQAKTEAPEAKPRPAAAEDEDEAKAKPRPALPEPVGAQRLSPRYPIWIDKKEKAVLVDGQICLR